MMGRIVLTVEIFAPDKTLVAVKAHTIEQGTPGPDAVLAMAELVNQAIDTAMEATRMV